jgi:hypothetical protein
MHFGNGADSIVRVRRALTASPIVTGSDMMKGRFHSNIRQESVARRLAGFRKWNDEMKPITHGFGVLRIFPFLQGPNCRSVVWRVDPLFMFMLTLGCRHFPRSQLCEL